MAKYTKLAVELAVAAVVLSCYHAVSYKKKTYGQFSGLFEAVKLKA